MIDREIHFMPSNFGRRLMAVCLSLVAVCGMAQRAYDLSQWKIQPANYSGITPLGEGRYAVVSDQEKQVGFYVWQIDIDQQTGEVKQVKSEGFRGEDYDIDRDAEGIAYCPQRGTLFVSGEADQRILEHNLDGGLTGKELAVPEWAGSKKIRSNRGFEALGYDAVHQEFWTTSEGPLKDDPDDVLRFICFGTDMKMKDQCVYHLDAQQAANHGRDHYHGVVAITPLGIGRLLFVLERECRIAPNYSGSRCWCKLFLFDPTTGEKQLVEAWATDFNLFTTNMANYEGMCLGPCLADGRITLLLVSDSQAGYGIGPWHLRDYLRVIVLPSLNAVTE